MNKYVYQDYYEFLKIPFGSDINKIKDAYKRKLIENHPDNFEAKTEEEKREAANNISIAKEALDILTDETKRRVYDFEYKQRNKNNSMKNNNSSHNLNSSIFNIFSATSLDSFAKDYYQHFLKREMTDFIEIIELEKRISKIYDELVIYEEREEQLDTILSSLLTKKKTFEYELRNNPVYLDAIDYISRFNNKLLFSKKKLQLLKECHKIKEKVEIEISKNEKQLNLEIEKFKEKKQIQADMNRQLREKLSVLNSQYYSHPLKTQYESYKQEKIREQQEYEKNARKK